MDMDPDMTEVLGDCKYLSVLSIDTKTNDEIQTMWMISATSAACFSSGGHPRVSRIRDDRSFQSPRPSPHLQEMVQGRANRISKHSAAILPSLLQYNNGPQPQGDNITMAGK